MDYAFYVCRSPLVFRVDDKRARKFQVMKKKNKESHFAGKHKILLVAALIFHIYVSSELSTVG